MSLSQGESVGQEEGKWQAVEGGGSQFRKGRREKERERTKRTRVTAMLSRLQTHLEVLLVTFAGGMADLLAAVPAATEKSVRSEERKAVSSPSS
jgi:cell division protein FtsB